MKPISYLKDNDNKTHFIYDAKEFDYWKSLGYKDGNVGMILMSRDEVMDDYWGFGTIENPMREPMGMSLIHNLILDGRRFTDEEIINPPYREEPITHSYRVIFLDSTDTEPNIKHINGHKQDN